MAREFSESFYKSARWLKSRQAYIISVKGLCEECKAKGVITPGKILHHKLELTPQNIQDPDITLNWDNLQFVCQECHNKIHHSKDVTRDGLMFDSNGDLIKSPH